jgi:uncharacterized protein (TIGR03437 family)
MFLSPRTNRGFVRFSRWQFRAAALTALLGFGWISAFGQFCICTFSGFMPGNLVVTRSVYTGDSSTVTIGQGLPPVCPPTAVCGTAVAISNGAYPTPASGNNVWSNTKVDGNFGVTSPVFLDQITPAGALVNTLAIPSNLLTTSFSSKSELAVNLSSDGSALTLIGYVAPENTLDVSNANTPGVYDPTNTAGGSYFRAVAQIGANGAIQITKSNAYSGSAGRAVILANGLYYMAGNSNNGSGTPANVVAATGVQIATPGQSSAAPPTQVGNFSITQIINPATGVPYGADKLGKDGNFRGLTIFNNTLYVTKGSGSNGINTVYQVGNAGSLPVLSNAGNTPIIILPGFPTTLARNANVNSLFPFGIWFANATTLYVADEGDGVLADAAISKMAGLQKWSLVNGTWQLDYVLQNGLFLGQQYSVVGYPASLNPATAGLRNLSGQVNNDGTVTLWAVTATVSANSDQGADPNKLVSITDVLANTTASNVTNEQFTTLRTAAAGEVLRGVSLAPGGAVPATNIPSIVSAASPSVPALAPSSLAFAFGQGLAGDPGEILGPLPTTFGGTSVSITDSAGQSWPAPLLFVSPSQVTFQIPPGVASGSARVGVTSGSATQSASNIQIAPVAPAVFTLNGSSLAAAYVVRVSADSTQTFVNVYTLIGGGSFVANPIKMTGSTDSFYLILYGTGLQAAGTAGVKVTMAGVNASITYAGPSGFAGVEQVNIQLPASLAGKGNVNVQLVASGIAANPVQITVQ